MPSANVTFPLPLIRFKTLFPGQPGVPGTDSERGLRTDSEGVVFWVDRNHVDANDGRDGTDPESPLATVGAALLKCEPYRGDTVAVMANNAWSYSNPTLGHALPVAEQVIVAVPGVRIVGVCPSGALGVVWGQTANAGTIIDVRACDVLIEGFVFWSPVYTTGRAIHAVYGGANTGDNLVVRHCTFWQWAGAGIATGIDLEFSWSGSIYENSFWFCTYGIYENPNLSPPAYMQIHHNVFHECTTGAISLPEVTDSHIWSNSIFKGTPGTDQGIDTFGGARNQVFDNYLSVPLGVAAGQYGDFCSGSGTDAWIQNFCTNGPTTTTP